MVSLMGDDIQRSMGRVEAKVDLLLERTEGYEKRLSSVEKKVWYGSGVAAVLAYVATNIIGK